MSSVPDDLAARVERSESAMRHAPGPLDLVQAFLNTENRIRNYDLLHDPGSAQWWLDRLGNSLVPSGASASSGEGLHEDDLDELRRSRAAIRGLLRSHTVGEPPPDAVLDDLRAIAAVRPLVLDFDDTGGPRAVPSPARSIAADLEGRVLAALLTATADGTLDRLKACANPECEWVFYDTSRSRSGSWCVMNLCGARHKMSRYRGRLRGDQDPAAEVSDGEPSASDSSASEP